MFRFLMSLSLSSVVVLALAAGAEAKGPSSGSKSGSHHSMSHNFKYGKDNFRYSHCYWNSRYGCYCYTCPYDTCDYYWCERVGYYVPVTYIEELPPVVIKVQPRVVVETPTVVVRP